MESSVIEIDFLMWVCGGFGAIIVLMAQRYFNSIDKRSHHLDKRMNRLEKALTSLSKDLAVLGSGLMNGKWTTHIKKRERENK